MATKPNIPNIAELMDSIKSGKIFNEVAKKVTESQIWTSSFRHGYADTPRNRVLQIASNVWLHLHPVKIHRHALRIRFTWCMGGITFLLFLSTVVTGVILMFYYRPVGEYAYFDMKYLQYDVPFGMLMRNMHRWAAHSMVITVWLHMFRVFLTGSYKPPREFNWVIGVFLVTFTLLLSFTGYLLPWDQLAMWAITVGSNMARATPFLGNEGPGNQLLNVGGFDLITSGSDARFLLLGERFVGEMTLNRFYILHCVAIPLVVAGLIAIHFWRVRKDGGISQPL